MPSSSKLIVTNMTALRKKYKEGYQEIVQAIDDLKAADADRGIDTTLIALDDKSALTSVGGKPVKSHKSAPQAKAAIDALYADMKPDYLLLLGGPDVIPHVNLKNPVTSVQSGDPDEDVPSDLPYACDHAYSLKPADFTQPTRVVGRVPDSFAATDPKHLVALLTRAAEAVPRPPKDFSALFAVSADVWKASSALSIEAITGKKGQPLCVPPSGTGWKKTHLRSRLHFYNCHGATIDPRFYGEDATGMPVALTSAELVGRVSEGTVVAAECCYGAEIYEAALANGVAPICERYLAEGAYGFFGSTTVAYGDTHRSELADRLVQYFLRRVREGKSLGVAALEARQQFVNQQTALEPFDLKTLAQFLLLGDPSVRPVKRPPAPKGPLHSLNAHDVLASSHEFGGTPEFDATLRRIRRGLAARIGRAGASVPVAEPVQGGRLPASVRDVLRSTIGAESSAKIERSTFAAMLDGTSLRFHYASTSPPAVRGGHGTGVVSLVTVRVIEVDGQVIAVQRIVSK